MEKTTHTPGPWHANAIAKGRIIGDASTPGAEKIQINNSNATVATVYRSSDARLIAAAPDLLAALRDILSRAEAVDTDSIECLCATMRDIAVNASAALAKADGKE